MQRRDISYFRLLLLTLLVSGTCMVISLIQETYRTIEHCPVGNRLDRGDSNQNLYRIEDKQDNHVVRNTVRETKTKTVYVITAFSDYKINNANICRGAEPVDVIVMVHTSPDHFWVRQEARRTWLNSTHYRPRVIKTVFLLGLVNKPDMQQKIEAESAEFGDIVQGDFIDSYRNLTNKGVMGYKWVSEHCMNARILIKVDDDAIINFFKYFEDVQSWLIPRKRTIFCNRIDPYTMPIIRGRGSKWFVHFDEYKNYTLYPHAYCSGFVVFISIDLVPGLYHAAIASPFFWVDDFFLFGLLPSRLKNVTFEKFGKYLTFSYPEAVKCYKKLGGQCSYLVMPAKKREIPIMWKALIADRKFDSMGHVTYGNFTTKNLTQILPSQSLPTKT